MSTRGGYKYWLDFRRKNHHFLSLSAFPLPPPVALAFFLVVVYAVSLDLSTSLLIVRALVDGNVVLVSGTRPPLSFPRTDLPRLIGRSVVPPFPRRERQLAHHHHQDVTVETAKIGTDQRPSMNRSCMLLSTTRLPLSITIPLRRWDRDSHWLAREFGDIVEHADLEGAPPCRVRVAPPAASPQTWVITPTTPMTSSLNMEHGA
ncbi:hypothetical protein B0H34DRAFT_860674 [Crassisporium funariophilum]|nr:hypothetical protein B0H34DRAFT_860674 [Crassisporium funariophilum]